MSHLAQPEASSSTDRRAIPAAKPPVGSGRITLIGVLIALLLIALAVVLGHDALVAAGVVGVSAWIDTAVQEVDGLQPATWVLPVSVVLVLVGAWLLVSALRPRPPTTVAVQAVTGVFLRPGDLRTLVRHTARDVDGVTDAKVSASRRKVDVRIETTGDDTARQRVQGAVDERLQALEQAPSVRVRTAGGSR